MANHPRETTFDVEVAYGVVDQISALCCCLPHLARKWPQTE